MVGQNKVEFNQAQMIKAIEHYMKEVLFDDQDFEVVSVMRAADGVANGGFEIRINGENLAGFVRTCNLSTDFRGNGDNFFNQFGI